MSIELEASYRGDPTTDLEPLPELDADAVRAAQLRDLLRAADYALWVAARTPCPIGARWAQFQAERLIACARSYLPA